MARRGIKARVYGPMSTTAAKADGAHEREILDSGKGSSAGSVGGGGSELSGFSSPQGGTRSAAKAGGDGDYEDRGLSIKSGHGLMGLAGLMGAFNRPEKLSEQGRMKQQAMLEGQQALSTAMQAYQDVFTRTGDTKQAAMAMFRTPGAMMGALASGMKITDMLKMAGQDAAAANSVKVIGDALVDSGGKELYRNERMYTQGSINQIGTGPNGEPIYSRQGSRGQVPGMTVGPADAGAKAEATAAGKAIGTRSGNAEADARGLPAPPGKAAPPYKMTDEEKRFLSNAPGVLQALQVMKAAGENGATGLVEGPAGKLFAKVFGTNDPANIWNNARGMLVQALADGRIGKSDLGGKASEYMATLPQNWAGERYNTTGINQMTSRMQQEAASRAAAVEHTNNGRPLPEEMSSQLSNVGVHIASKGWDNWRAALQAGPTGAAQLTDREFKRAYDNRHLLTPEEREVWIGELSRREMQRQGAPPAQDQQAPAAPGQGGGEPPATDFGGGQAGAPPAAPAEASPPTPPPGRQSAAPPQMQEAPPTSPADLANQIDPRTQMTPGPTAQAEEPNLYEPRIA